MALLVTILIIAIALGAYVWRQNEPVREQAQQDSLAALRDFTAASSLLGVDGGNGVALDPGAGALALIRAGQTAQQVPVARLLGAELYRDGEKMNGVYRAGAQAAARREALRLAPPAYRPPMTEQTRWLEVERLELRLILDDVNTPAHDVRLLDREIRQTDAAYGEAVAIGEYWLRQLDALMR